MELNDIPPSTNGRLGLVVQLAGLVMQLAGLVAYKKDWWCS